MARSWGSWDSDFQNRPPKLPRPLTSSVPLWEKRFCTSVCAIPWGKICAAKASLHTYKNIAEWDDSEALEAFHNAKSRYYSYINHIPCNIPFPDPNLYIDEVDHNTIIDPKLIEDLEKEEPPSLLPCNNNNENSGWDTSNDADKGNGEAEVTKVNHSNVNWDKYIENPASTATNKWKSNDAWAGLDNNVTWNDGRNDPWGQRGNCVDSWGDVGNSRSWNNGNGLDSLWGSNGNNLNVNSRKRNGGYYNSNYSTSRDNNNYHGNYSNNSNMMEHQFEKSKSRRFYGPGNNQRPSESGAFWYRRNR